MFSVLEKCTKMNADVYLFFTKFSLVVHVVSCLVQHEKCLLQAGDFYSATLCVSAIYAVARCLSVRLSDTFVHSIQTAADIVKLLVGPVAQSF